MITLLPLDLMTFHAVNSAFDTTGSASLPTGGVFHAMARFWIIGLVGFVLLGSAACAGDAAPMQVGEVTFSQEELRGLSRIHLRTLARITAVGLAVRSDDVLRLGRPVIEGRLRSARIQRLREEVALEEAGVGEQVLRARYDTSPDWELEVRHLVVLSERWRSDTHRDAARARAREALSRILAGEPFAAVAGAVSDEPGAAERGGLLQPGREGTWVAEFWEAAVALEPGEVSGVVETEYGFHVLELEDRRPIPFEEARPRVAAEVAAMIADRAAWERWVDDRVAELELLPSRLPEGGLPSQDDSSIVARWEGGEVTAGDVARDLRGSPSRDVKAFLTGDGDARARIVRDVATRRFLAAEADLRGIQVPPPVAAAVERDWERRVASWTLSFGFEPGMPLDALRERALSGLAGSGQSVAIARDEVNEHGPTLDAAFPHRLPPTP